MANNDFVKVLFSDSSFILPDPNCDMNREGARVVNEDATCGDCGRRVVNGDEPDCCRCDEYTSCSCSRASVVVLCFRGHHFMVREDRYEAPCVVSDSPCNCAESGGADHKFKSLIEERLKEMAASAARTSV